MAERVKSKRANEVARLIRAGVDTPKKIIAAINQDPRWAYDKAPEKALLSDLGRLKDGGIVFRYDRQKKRYVEEAGEGVLLPFSDDELAVLAQLREVHRFTPFREAAERVIEKLGNMVSPKQRGALKRQSLIKLNVPALEELTHHLATAEVIEKAFQTQRELAIQYQMSGKTEAYPMRVQVLNPLELRDGHAYFEVWSLLSDAERLLRLDRVVLGSAQVLPNKRARRTQHSTLVTIQYWLGPGLEPSKHFPIDFEVVRSETGCVVSAKIEERQLFWAAKILLKYGQNCMALAPPSLVDEMRHHAEGMARLYGLMG
jgi:predicted DNA-binding transcriptional regulator YafY